MKKLLKSKLFKGTLKALPGVGDIVRNIDSPEGGQGKIDKENLPSDIIKVLIIGVLLYLALSGKMSFEDAGAAKDFLTQ